MNKNVVSQEIVDLLKIGDIFRNIFNKLAIFRPYLNKEEDFVPDFKFNPEQINIFFSIVEEIEKNNLLLKRAENFFWDKVEHFSPEAGWGLISSSWISNKIREVREIAKKFMAYKHEEEWGQFTDKQFVCEINSDIEEIKAFKNEIKMFYDKINYLELSSSCPLFQNPAAFPTNLQ
ncbi:MAG: hypothetical protein WC894_05470 [Patescibacteria group bacterium]